MIHPRYLDEDLCVLYREANLRFPQVEVGIVPMVANLVLRRGVQYLIDSLTLPFSPQQVASIREGMNRAHSARGIPALATDAVGSLSAEAQLGPDDTFDGIRIISDDRIQAVWRNIVLYTIDAIVDCVRVIAPAAPLPSDCSEETYRQMPVLLAALFTEDPALHQETSAMFATTVRALESVEAQRLATNFRAALDFRDIQSGRKLLQRSRQVLHDGLAELMVRQIHEEHGRFASIIESKRWRIFRPLMSS